MGNAVSAILLLISLICIVLFRNKSGGKHTTVRKIVIGLLVAISIINLIITILFKVT